MRLRNALDARVRRLHGVASNPGPRLGAAPSEPSSDQESDTAFDPVPDIGHEPDHLTDLPFVFYYTVGALRQDRPWLFWAGLAGLGYTVVALVSALATW